MSSLRQAASKDKIDPLVFQQIVRKLWEDHVTWTRVYIIAALADLPEADAAAQRLLKNQADIGNTIKPFYGNEASEQLTSLLKDHILIAVDLLAAAKSGDTSKFEEANAHWYDRASQIAAFLHSANPEHWTLSNTIKSTKRFYAWQICFRTVSCSSSRSNLPLRKYPNRKLISRSR